MKNMTKLGLAVLLGLAAGQASAAFSLFAQGPTNFTFTTDDTALPLSVGGATTRTFKTTVANERVVIAYNAECGYATTTAGDWTGVDIVVDGVVIPPSNSDDAMCTSDGTNSYKWIRPIMNVFYTVPTAGTHTIQVKGRISGTGTAWYGDSTLIITK